MKNFCKSYSVKIDFIPMLKYELAGGKFLTLVTLPGLGRVSSATGWICLNFRPARWASTSIRPLDHLDGQHEFPTSVGQKLIPDFFLTSAKSSALSVCLSSLEDVKEERDEKVFHDQK